jgi:hypothetical protein
MKFFVSNERNKPVDLLTMNFITRIVTTPDFRNVSTHDFEIVDTCDFGIVTTPAFRIVATYDFEIVTTYEFGIVATPDFRIVTTYDLKIFANIHYTFRVIKSLKTPNTDTDDTDEDRAVGGHSMYSHNSMCLNHQHWVDQCISGGGFNVHCAQGPEASHKYNMHIACARVRHGDANDTQDNMLKYLCERSVFHLLFLMMVVCDRPTRKSPRPAPGLHKPLPVEFGRNLLKASFRKSFISSAVRVAVSELIILVCNKIEIEPTLQSFRKLAGAHIVLGKKFTRTGNATQSFWATDNPRSSIAGARRDMLRVKGSVDGTALGAEAICFVHISNLRSVCQIDTDAMDLVLIRWLTPHRDAWERDSLLRPVCPGPFHVNNCLWKYAVTPRDRTAEPDHCNWIQTVALF